ncbi:HD domain-containing protein [Merismopedia glauca]|uniref:Phosphohydrolase n=1 Tax=Merismopedia glauca CCAP 1448/3 TaxID=1296344 RepID=A0A2T1BYN7_9CYAN|nr:HD domain-containing protein [Merismopedia glauca]PSB01027.1 hypothetical protein C7B64_20480 [Merismopedia glauca CCAP 1448/3]
MSVNLEPILSPSPNSFGMEETKIDPYAKLFIAMRYWLLGKGLYRALNALEYASKLHTGVRKDGVTREYSHQLSIGHYIRSISTSLTNPEECLATVFLHDVCEDCGIAVEEIEAQFGSTVSEAVWLLTKKYRAEKKPLDRYYGNISQNPIASIVKGADRIHNVQSMLGVFDLSKQQQYIQETQEYILPALKEARRKFPQQEPAYENIKHMLQSQIELLSAVHKALDSDRISLPPS